MHDPELLNSLFYSPVRKKQERMRQNRKGRNWLAWLAFTLEQGKDSGRQDSFFRFSFLLNSRWMRRIERGKAILRSLLWWILTKFFLVVIVSYSITVNSFTCRLNSFAHSLLHEPGNLGKLDERSSSLTVTFLLSFTHSPFPSWTR